MLAASSLPSLPEAVSTPLGAEVYRGMTTRPKKLSPWVFYDERGSELFERITELPEYYLTRTERGIFEADGEAILAAAGSKELAIIELGAGTAVKTEVLLGAAVRAKRRVTYYPIDIAESALDAAARRIGANLPDIAVEPRVGDFLREVTKLPAPGCRRMVLYIGSSIGNFEPDRAITLLRRVRQQLKPGDLLLLGADHVKDRGTLLRAYNDSAGVTAEFNRNALCHINRELGAKFRPRLFRHRAVWNERECRVEIHLESLITQEVAIPSLGLNVPFRRGESIHTENCYKFTPERVAELFERGGFTVEQSWTDAKRWFGVYLGKVA
ncbi:MAG TPA: L-histidine N(alpha)-methyltransferase [Acidobacteriaceae bacterium]|nr:L-histidine N(alpha)-methyltransferase [Acidobacteriaceae bacterium]